MELCVAGTEPPPEVSAATSAAPHFDVERYLVQDNGLMPTNVWFPILSKYTGTNVSLDEIVKGASELQAAYGDRGHPLTSIAIAPREITNGVVTLNVFQAAIPQVMVSGIRYYCPASGMVSNLPAIAPALAPETAAVPGTNAAETTSLMPFPAAATRTRTAGGWPVPPPAPSPAQSAQARVALVREFAEIEEKENDTRIHVVSTNAGPRFNVQHYLISGNSVLAPQTIAATLTNIDGAFGTNVSFEGVKTVVEQLQEAYRDRGYLTVEVGLPQQRLANATVKVQVTEGRLATIDVEGNNYFSSNNVMRALPSLHTNILINAKILQAELNRANANQDRKIYPVVAPGPDPGTSALILHVKDQLPLHAKTDLDNFSSPGTPALRVNTSAVYNNLWQQGHAVGVQYSFSPELYKQDNGWNFYDKPVVANYSVFYRLPLGQPTSLEDQINANPGTFGYSEATRKFNLPPMSALPTLTLFASRSTIDTGTQTTPLEQVSIPGNNPLITRQTSEHSPTIDEDIAAHLDYPLATSGNLQSSFSGGLDFKFFQVINYETNFFNYTQTNNYGGVPTPVTTASPSQVPTTIDQVYYLPLSLRYTGSWHDSLGSSTIGLGLSANLWYNSFYSTITSGVTTTTHGQKAIGDITGSTLSSGHWVVLNPSYFRTVVIDDWTTLLRLDGQWASEPLISPEQFGAGGVNSVRGYPEGDVFGDEGWHFSLDQQTPVDTVGKVYGDTPLTVFASAYMDYATVHLIDPQSRPSVQALWGTGMGFTVAAGPHWQARFMFSFPLISTSDTPAYQPRFNFALTAQF